MPTNTKDKAGTNEVKKFESKYGYFTEDGREYVITRHDTPRPWVNVISNKGGDYAFTVSQTGGGFSWKNNSNLARITRWDQDLIRDNWGKYLYVRDNKSGEFWSDTYKPCNTKFDSYEVRHGLGYTTFKSSYNGIAIEKTMYVAMDDSVELWKVELKNESDEARSLSLFSYFEWCLGNAGETHREFQKTFIETEIDEKNGALFGRKRMALVPDFVSSGLAESPLEAFHSASVKPTAYDGDKESFFGRYGEQTAPARVQEGKLGNTQGKWGDSSASLQVDVEIPAGESKVVVFSLGSPETREESEALIKKYSDVATAEAELEKAKKFWNDFIDSTWIETPDEAMNFTTNIWMKYQAVSARIWGKCAYYQSSGGYGFRDQLQDSQIFYSTQPELARKQILMHAKEQFPDGTVHHWWHEGTRIGAITEMTDDLLWLAFLTLNYVDETNDTGVWDAVAPYLPDPKTGEVEEGSVYDHCLRAFDRVFKRWSPRGLPLIGEGDWNDGMSHVGTKWKGESIWLGHFFYGILTRFAPVSEERGDSARAKDLAERAQKLKDAINEHAWDGEWYIRATRDDGRPLGSKTQDEGKIFLNAQTWAVINGTATEERGKQAMESVKKYLYREYGPLLFTPGYSKTDPTIGYLSRYAASVRENGGLYTHAGTWAVQAECVMRNGDQAYDVYKSFNPIYRGANPDHYYAEPYVTPGNVDGPDSPNFGRGGWTWYTGSASWYAVIIMNWFLGVRPERSGLKIDPVIPKEWPSFKMKRLFRGATYNIEVTNPNGTGQGVAEITVDGKKIEGNLIAPQSDNGTHEVKVTLK